MAYARRLTREDLERAGITNITEDGKVFRQGLEIPLNITPTGYHTLWIYDLDQDGNFIKYGHDAKGHYFYKQRLIGLHRAMWAWFHGEVPSGMVVDHINNQHLNIEDYNLSNLQLLTPAENTAKDRGNWFKHEITCKLNKPRSHYENKLRKYLEMYEQAKLDGDQKLCHKLRSNVSNCRARLRYYDAHIDEVEVQVKANSEEATRREYKRRRAAQIRQFKEELRILRTRFLEARDTYGPNHEITLEAKAKWKTGVAVSNEWIRKNPAVRIKED